MKFDNESSKKFLARKGPTKVFGKDVDRRERFSDQDAIDWFNDIWSSKLESAAKNASACDIDFVRDKVPLNSRDFINETASHREFTLNNCMFICQLRRSGLWDQLWFIPSTSGDPRTLYVKFETVPIKEEFDQISQKLGWDKPNELGLKILLDFMESVTKVNYRDPNWEDKE